MTDLVQLGDRTARMQSRQQASRRTAPPNQKTNHPMPSSGESRHQAGSFAACEHTSPSLEAMMRRSMEGQEERQEGQVERREPREGQEEHEVELQMSNQEGRREGWKKQGDSRTK
jgi:U3 small nucleolar RNA-associated protein 14